MTDKPTVSQSKARRWDTCRASYHYKYNLLLHRRRVARPLTFGSAVHKVIEDTVEGVPRKNLKKSLDKWANEELADKKYFTAEVELFREAVEDAWTIMREYEDFWPANHLTYLEVNGRKSEHEIHFEPKGEDFIITGKIDAYAQSKNKLKWMVEHKSGKSFMSEDERWRSIQVALYDVVGAELGFPTVDGIVWDMIKSKPPTRPQLLVKGTFSLKALDSLPMTVYNTIMEAGQNPNNYPTLLAAAERNRSNYFQRIFQPVTSNVKTHLYKTFTETARDILDNGHKTHRMTIGKHCSWCDYEPICRAIMTDSDPDYVMEKEFTRAEATTKAKGGSKVVKKVKSKVAGKRRQSGR